MFADISGGHDLCLVLAVILFVLAGGIRLVHKAYDTACIAFAFACVTLSFLIDVAVTVK